MEAQTCNRCVNVLIWKKKKLQKVEKKYNFTQIPSTYFKKGYFHFLYSDKSILHAMALESRATNDCSLARLPCIPVESSPVLPSVDDYDKIQKHVFAINSSG